MDLAGCTSESSSADPQRTASQRRIHMDAIECLELASSSEGALPLTNPSVCKTAFKKQGRTIPRTKLKYHPKPIHSVHMQGHDSNFVKASSIPLSSKHSLCQSTSTKDISSHRIKKFKATEQNNTILNYFCSPKKPSSNLQPNKQINSDQVQQIKTNNQISDNLLLTSFDDSQNFPPASDNRCIDNKSFGLFGTELIDISSDDESEEIDYFAILPMEIFETILCQVPVLDLLLSLNRVSRYWYETINNSQFLPWKKKYFRLKAGDEDVMEQFRVVCDVLHNKSIKYCYEILFRFVNTTFTRRPSDDLLTHLRYHPMYKEAEAALIERFPGYVIGGVPNPWCLICCLVLISKTFDDVYDILHYLTLPSSRCPLIDIMECLYCIATFLLYAKNAFNITHGLHHRVYYALYIYENQWTGSTQCLDAVKQNLGQQSILKYSSNSSIRLTHEQMRIVNHNLCPGHVVKIVAFAGTGKTSTLKEYARLRPSLKFLNVMFNKSVCSHAEKVFTSNVKCRTVHSLAWEGVGHLYKHKLTFKIKPLDIIHLVKKDESISFTLYQYAWCVLTTLSKFMASADELITTAHAPSEISNADRQGIKELQFEEKQLIVRDAEKLWDRMMDVNDYDVRIVHDGYLKLFQLSHPVVSGYNCIFIDEAQDCNAAMLDFLLSQSCPKILVGDPNQQIYAFRGAINALNSVQSTHVYYLTQSFRFGPEIAYVASCALEVMQRIQTKTLVGGSQKGTVSGQREGQLAIIARCNATLFNEAVRICCRKETYDYEPTPVRGAFAGGLHGYGLDDIVDIYKLVMKQNGDSITDNEIKNRFIKRFKSFADLQRYAKHTEDNELQGKIRLVLQHHENIPEYVETIKAKCKYSMDMANVVFATVHKSKGLEFDTVCLTEDYSIGQIPYELGTLDRSSGLLDEYNILYVAVTRAKKSLILSKCMYFIILGAQEKFERPVSSEKAIKELGTDTIDCVICYSKFKLNRALVLKRNKMTLTGGVSLPAGYFCIKCAADPWMNFPFPHHTVSEVYRPVEDISHRIGAALFGPFPGELPLGELPHPSSLYYLENFQPGLFEIAIL